MDSIIRPAEESLTRALSFYQQVGTPLSYRPKLMYVDSLNLHALNATAMVNGEGEIRDKCIEFISKNLSKAIWINGYGIDLSDEAILELSELNKKTYGKVLVREEFKSGIDILIFKPFSQYIDNKQIRDEIIAHETWHLIEKERGLLQEHPFIIEGTATYASLKINGLYCKLPLEGFNDFFDMMYFGGANLVKSYVESTRNPFHSMLDREVRFQMQQEMLERVKPHLINSIKHSLKNEDYRKAFAHTSSQIPEFASLKGNLSGEGLINAYRKMGAIKVADEMQGKDLEQMLNLFRLAGF